MCRPCHVATNKQSDLQMNLVGYGGGNVPCKHLFLGEIAYFYTSDEKFCCLSGGKTNRQGFGPLTAPQRNWTRTLKSDELPLVTERQSDAPCSGRFSLRCNRTPAARTRQETVLR